MSVKNESGDSRSYLEQLCRNDPPVPTTIWEEMPVDSMHAYRVRSATDRKFIKWGTAQQLAEALAASEVASVVPYQPEHSATLEAFLGEDDD